MQVVDGDVRVHDEEAADLEYDTKPDFLSCGQRVAAAHGGRDDGRYGAAQKGGDDLDEAAGVERDGWRQRAAFSIQQRELVCDAQYIVLVQLVVGHETVAEDGAETHGHEREPCVAVEALAVRRVGEQRVDGLGVVEERGCEYAARGDELVAHVRQERGERLPGDAVDGLFCDEPDEADRVRESLGGRIPRVPPEHGGPFACDGAEEAVEEGEPGGGGGGGGGVEGAEVGRVGEDGREERERTGPVPGAVRGVQRECGVQRVHGGGRDFEMRRVNVACSRHNPRDAPPPRGRLGRPLPPRLPRDLPPRCTPPRPAPRAARHVRPPPPARPHPPLPPAHPPHTLARPARRPPPPPPLRSRPRPHLCRPHVLQAPPLPPAAAARNASRHLAHECHTVSSAYEMARHVRRPSSARRRQPHRQGLDGYRARRAGRMGRLAAGRHGWRIAGRDRCRQGREPLCVVLPVTHDAPR